MRVDTSEIQGLVASGYPGLHAMCVWWFAIDDVPAMQAWLRSMSKRWAFIGDHTDLKLHLALTYAGGVELGAPRHGWEPAFVEGLCDPRRSRILGDVGDDAPLELGVGRTRETRAARRDPVLCPR